MITIVNNKVIEDGVNISDWLSKNQLKLTMLIANINNLQTQLTPLVLQAQTLMADIQTVVDSQTPTSEVSGTNTDAPLSTNEGTV